MYGIENFWLFLVSALLLNLLPGPDTLLIGGRAATQGFRAGSVATLGVGTGILFHITAAALGLSAILATSATAFTVIKVLGGLYLIYMAVQMFRDTSDTGPANTISTGKSKPAKASLKKIYMQGLITNVFNPKVALFFLAFMPQFIAESSENKALAFFVLGLAFYVLSMVFCHVYALMVASLSQKLAVNKTVGTWLSRFTAGVFGVFGVKLLVSTQS